MNFLSVLGHYPWIGSLSAALQLAFLVHAVSPRRNFFWVFILLFGSYIGALAYFFVEVSPGLRGNARRVGANQKPALSSLRPLEIRVRQAQEQLSESDTLQRRTDLAALLAQAQDQQGAERGGERHLPAGADRRGQRGTPGALRRVSAGSGAPG